MREVWLLDPPAVVVAGINMGSGAVVHHTGWPTGRTHRRTHRNRSGRRSDNWPGSTASDGWAAGGSAGPVAGCRPTGCCRWLRWVTRWWR